MCYPTRFQKEAVLRYTVLVAFALNYKPPRIGRNPKTGERVQVPAKYVPPFKAGKELKKSLRNVYSRMNNHSQADKITVPAVL